MNGYTGRILRVNLGENRAWIEEPGEGFYRRYLGGSALNLAYILDLIPEKTDPLSPANILGLAVGPVAGLAISGQSRLSVNALSPLTGGIGDSQVGGYFPAELKRAGLDAVIISGRAEKPVYLWIRDGRAEIRPADHLWSRYVGDTTWTIQDELGEEKARVLAIGPAGEKRVRFAAIIGDLNRAAGRTGMGAVMGAKNLKAIAVRGSGRVAPADPEEVKKWAAWGAERFPRSMVYGLGRFGTAGGTSAQHKRGGLPTRNYTSGVFEGISGIAGLRLYNEYRRGAEEEKQDTLGRASCFGCLIRCKPVVEVRDGPYKSDYRSGGPEYETLAALGSYCGVNNLAAIIKGNELCAKHGLDTISCGGTIAWAMAAFEAGQLSLEQTAGVELNFGNAEAMVNLIGMIGRREGLGDILAEGSARAAEKLGLGAEFLTTIKGQELPAHMPHLKRSLALIYAVNPFGPDHQSSAHDPDYEADYDRYADRLSVLGLAEPQPQLSLTPEKVRFAYITQAWVSMIDSAALCQFAHGPTWQLYGPAETTALLGAVTGWDLSPPELLEIGHRRVAMMRRVNNRQGVGPEDDGLPRMLFEQPLTGGKSDGYVIDREEFRAARREYYRLAGWGRD